jgi:hypothetical protein
VATGATAFAALKAERAAIEAAFGEPLEWEEPPAIGGWRIRHRTEGGYRDAEAEWPKIQDRMIKAMIRLDAAVRARVAKLP